MPIDSERLSEIFNEQTVAFERLICESAPVILHVADVIADCLRGGGKVLICGNGGSAADAQHVAAELVGRFSRERRAWPVLALTTDTSILTAVGNDYGFDHVFERQVEAFAKQGDVVVGISTSGKSPNIIRALKTAKKVGAICVGFTGESGGVALQDYCDVCFIAPAHSTPRIQELHLAVWHAVCDLVEGDLTTQ